jgi:transposase
MYNKNAKDPIYYVQVGIRQGKKTTTKNIARIGKHSELLRDHSDPLAYAREYVRKLNEQKEMVDITLYLNFAHKLLPSDDDVSRSLVFNTGYLVLDRIYRDLNIRTVLEKMMSETRATFDLNQIVRFLVFDRILDPGSKLHTVCHLDSYYERPRFDYQHVLRGMDVLSENFDNYICHLYEASSKIIKRDTTVCYYDCTNYYSEIETADEDTVDEYTGEIIEGFRKYGLSKDHKPNPLVQMGLFMDSDGIPMSMCLTKGNEAETNTVLPLEKKLVRIIKNSDFIYCADAGLGSYDIRKFNAMGGRRFIVTQSLKKLPDTLKEAVFNDSHYRLLSNGREISIETMKSFDPASNLSLYQDRAYKVEDASKELVMDFPEERIIRGKKKTAKAKATLGQRIIITFSRKSYEYQRKIRAGQIERAKKLLKTSDPEAIKKGANDVRRFIRRKASTKESYILDEEKIREEEKYDGYYIIATNVYDKSVQEILDISSKRYRIEECFRITKNDFVSRPYYHRLKERIIAHFMLCYTALLIYRLLEVQLDRNGTHFTTRQIIETLKNMNVTDFDGFIYKSLYTDSRTLQAIMKIYPLKLDHQYYLKTTLDKLIG